MVDWNVSSGIIASVGMSDVFCMCSVGGVFVFLFMLVAFVCLVCLVWLALLEFVSVVCFWLH